MEALHPYKIIKWIPYNNFQDIKYITKGGWSEIDSAKWTDGRYDEWNSIEKQLKRFGSHEVVLKNLKNVESANRIWFDEVIIFLLIFFFQAEDGIRDYKVTGVQTCALPISHAEVRRPFVRGAHHHLEDAGRDDQESPVHHGPQHQVHRLRLVLVLGVEEQIGRASCRERV